MQYGSLCATFGTAPNVLFGVFSVLYVLAGLYVYTSLIHQIRARRPSGVTTNAPARIFGIPEAIVAALLILFFSLSIVASVSHPRTDFSKHTLRGNLPLMVVLVLFFRFFLYNVIKRYFGRLFGVTFSALLFAAAHAHFPSFVPLFVLGSCFALAYEWSGSILVAMTMHSLFNSLTLTALAFPEIFSP